MLCQIVYISFKMSKSAFKILVTQISGKLIISAINGRGRQRQQKSLQYPANLNVKQVSDSLPLMVWDYQKRKGPLKTAKRQGAAKSAHKMNDSQSEHLHLM